MIENIHKDIQTNLKKYNHELVNMKPQEMLTWGYKKFNNQFSVFETLLSGFPAGTVSGAPKIRAMEIIDELEKNKRKLYAGGIGYFTPNDEFDTCIALRTALIKNDKFYVQAGAGIVADSKPEKEYLETINKA